jgi:hypothetical protein
MVDLEEKIPELRFTEGDRVECNCAEGWKLGTIVKRWCARCLAVHTHARRGEWRFAGSHVLRAARYREYDEDEGDYVWNPYQIQRDDGNLIFAHGDADTVIRAAPADAPESPLYEITTEWARRWNAVPVHRRLVDVPHDLYEGETPYPEILAQQIDAGRDPGTPVQIEGASGHPVLSTPLVMAALKGNAKLVRMLLDSGADPSVGATDGCTAVHAASQAGSLHVLELLLQHQKVNANVKLEPPLQLNPLDAAVLHGSIEPDEEGPTDHAGCVRLLLQCHCESSGVVQRAIQRACKEKDCACGLHIVRPRLAALMEILKEDATQQAKGIQARFGHHVAEALSPPITLPSTGGGGGDVVELEVMNVKTLRKRARAAGVAEAAVEGTLVADDPKAAIIALLEAARGQTPSCEADDAAAAASVRPSSAPRKVAPSARQCRATSHVSDPELPRAPAPEPEPELEKRTGQLLPGDFCRATGDLTASDSSSTSSTSSTSTRAAASDPTTSDLSSGRAPDFDARRDGPDFIAEGRFSVVFKGTCGVDGETRACAVKKIPRAYEAKQELALLRLTGAHRNIVATYDFYDGYLDYGDDRPNDSCIVTELCDGTLYELIAAGELEGMSARLSACRQFCEGLAHLHGYGVLHRDLKPDNVLFAGGELKIADLGQVLIRL